MEELGGGENLLKQERLILVKTFPLVEDKHNNAFPTGK